MAGGAAFTGSAELKALKMTYFLLLMLLHCSCDRA